VFAAQTDADLPQLEGPDGRAGDVAARYRAWSDVLAPLALTVREVRLSPRGGWQVRAAGPAGALSIDLPREEPDARLARFVAVHGRTLGALARSGTRVDAVDLRYRNGFAARIPAFRERAGKPKA